MVACWLRSSLKPKQQGVESGAIPTRCGLFYNGSTTTQLTNNTTNDYDPAISGSNIVWVVGDGTDSEIYYSSNIARSDRFSFTVSDGAGGSTDGTFNFTLTP